MPSGNTFTVRPIGDFVKRYLAVSNMSVDPFARNNDLAYWTNDINPATSAKYHMDAEKFLLWLGQLRPAVQCDLAILDPPYSPRQVADCYSAIGLDVRKHTTQTSALYARVRAALLPILSPRATVLSFGWNSSGMGKQHGFEIREVLLVAHGGAHNDTICLAEQRLPVVKP